MSIKRANYRCNIRLVCLLSDWYSINSWQTRNTPTSPHGKAPYKENCKLILKKLYITLIVSKEVVEKPLLTNQHMHNFHAILAKILDIHKKFTGNFVNEQINVLYKGIIPSFSIWKLSFLGLSANHPNIESEIRLFSAVSLKTREKM